MSNVFAEDRETQNIGGYGGFGGSGIAMIVLVVIVLFFLFKDGNHGYNHGSYAGGGIQPVAPVYKDESNYQQEANMIGKLCGMDRDIWKTDSDVWKTSCETQQTVHCEGEKTRALIEGNYIQDLRDKLAEKNAETLVLKQEMFTEKKFDAVMAAICGTNSRIERLECEVPKRAPVFAECVTPYTHRVDCEPYPRRGRIGECCD